MGTSNIVDFARRDESTGGLTELLKTGAQQLIASAVEADLVSYLAQFTCLRTDAGHAAVVRNGHLGIHALQATIFISHRLQLRDHRCAHATKRCTPFKKGGIAYAMFAAKFGNLQKALALLQYPHNLYVAVSFILHSKSPRILFQENSTSETH